MKSSLFIFTHITERLCEKWFKSFKFIYCHKFIVHIHDTTEKYNQKFFSCVLLSKFELNVNLRIWGPKKISSSSFVPIKSGIFRTKAWRYHHFKANLQKIFPSIPISTRNGIRQEEWGLLDLCSWSFGHQKKRRGQHSCKKCSRNHPMDHPKRFLRNFQKVRSKIYLDLSKDQLHLFPEIMKVSKVQLCLHFYWIRTREELYYCGTTSIVNILGGIILNYQFSLTYVRHDSWKH